MLVSHLFRRDSFGLESRKASWYLGRVRFRRQQGSREGPSPLPIRELHARLDPVLPDCEPRPKHGGLYDVAAVARARQFRAA
jgi:hypothetical protein